MEISMKNPLNDRRFTFELFKKEKSIFNVIKYNKTWSSIIHNYLYIQNLDTPYLNYVESNQIS